MSKTSLRDLSLSEAALAVRNGEVTSVDLADAFLSHSEQVEPGIGAFLHLERDEVLQAAEEIDQRRARGEALGELAGVPIAIKDNIATTGMPTTCASRILEGHRPVRDATAVRKLREAGAVLFGKTNLDEFGMGSSTENSAYHVTRNPLRVDRVPGGSSGGSAAAVASGQAPAALGSDTGGSVRQPAAFCGLVGLKPQYGRVSRSGLVAFASSLDVIGPMGRSAEDVRLLLNVISGPDSLDSTSRAGGSSSRPGDSTSRPGGSPTGPENRADAPLPSVLGIPRRWIERGAGSDVVRVFEETCEWFRAHGVELREIELEAAEQAVATYYVIADAEASSNLSRYDGVRFGYRAQSAETLEELYTRTRGEGFGLEVKRRILLGTFVLSAGYYDAYYGQAQRVRSRIRSELETVLSGVEGILLPTTPTPPFPLGQKSDDPLEMYLSDLYTLPASLAGIPAVSFPAGQSEDGLPVGMQLYGRDDSEQDLLDWVSRFESSTRGNGGAS